MEIAEVVRKWFRDEKLAYGPVLPDGWFGGRPYENAFALERVDVSSEEVVLRLNAATSLTFYRPRIAAVSDNSLVIRGFDWAVLRWPHDLHGYREQVYTEGEVKFVVPYDPDLLRSRDT